MPIYLYQNPKTKKIVEVVQTMNEKHVYSENGVQFRRVFTVPQAAVDTKQDPFSEKQFVLHADNKKHKMGDLMDRSEELSQKRAALNGGVDPVKEKFFKDYSAKRKGKKHPSDPSRYEKLSKLGASISTQSRKLSG